MQVVTVASNKGGVGKTTLAVNLAVYLRALRPEVPVLLIELDDQSLVDRMFAQESAAPSGEDETIAAAWSRGDLRSRARLGRYGVHYIPTSGAMSALKARVQDPFELAGLLERAAWDGTVIVDTKSDLEILTQNAIAASDLTLLVVSDHSSLVEAEKVFPLLESWGMPRARARVLLSLVDLRVKYRDGEHNDVLGLLLSEIRQRDFPLFETFLSRSPKVEALYTNAAAEARSILHEARGSSIHRQMRALAEELLALLAARQIDESRSDDRARASASEPAAAGAERRAALRHRYRRKIPVFRQTEPPILLVETRDLSSGGARFVGDAVGGRGVELGERLCLALETDARPLMLWGRITRLPGGSADHTAVAFETLAAELGDQLDELLETLPAC